MKNFRIGIIGTENYHAQEFTRIFNQPDENGNFRYSDCHVTYVWGHYPEASEKVVNECGADKIAESLDEMVKSVDAVMITARDGKFHMEFAKPFIEAGIPAFIDKPFTVDIDDAKKLIASAQKNNVPLCGGSSLKYSKEILAMKEAVKNAGDKLAGGMISAPVDFNSEYSGFYFYASHLVEMTLEVFGQNPKTVTAKECKGNVTAIVGYDGFNVTNHFNNQIYNYFGSIFAHDNSYHQQISLDGCFLKECDVFVEMLRSNKMPCTYEQLIKPVLYMNAVEKAYKTGKTVEIDYN